ncbi:hypothetical protein BJ741DRAFT_542203 [Chytriomyces cf. hyalinus JEL632]|nr:hypothetical protein BJ741DRAFT_542203 [Chytriomyces cf. hyalinus JEL632]
MSTTNKATGYSRTGIAALGLTALFTAAAFVYKSRTASSVQRAPTLSDTRPFTGATYHPSTFSLDKIPSLSGKTALVTGGNTGIGYHTCKHLALNGANVLMACRDKERANNAIARIQNEAVAAGKIVDIEFVHLDLADLAQVKQAAVAVSQRIAKLDILVNNAGIMDITDFCVCRTYLKSMFAVNHLGHFMLTKHLMPSILMSSNPRVVILSSYAQWRAPLCGIDFSSLTNFNESYAGTHYYGQSKLANLLFSNELAARYPHKLLVNAVHPGLVATDLIRTEPGTLLHFAAPILRALMPLFALTAEKGASATLYAATSKDVLEQRITGKYMIPHGVVSNDYNPIADDADLAKRLWDFSEDVCRRY